MYLIVSDIHGSEKGMNLIMHAAKHFQAEGILSAGDQCPDPLYQSFYSSLIQVRGNCDRFYEYISSFPPVERELTIYGHRTVITHGDRKCAEDYSLSPGDVFISGHTHVPSLTSSGGAILCNPGSPSRPRSSEGPTAALFLPEGLRLFSLIDFRIIKAIRFSLS